MRLMRAVVLSAVMVFLISLALHAAPAPTGDWFELIDVTQLPYLKDGITQEVSSYDRTGGNDDGFSGKTSFVRKEGDKLVLFDEKGPGCIYRVWSANPGKVHMRFYFDGETEPRIDIPEWEQMFRGRIEPFMPPVSINTLGGWCSYVPIPFAKSCKVVADGPVFFYQISWQKFPDGRKVKTFSAQMSSDEKANYERVKTAWSSIGNNPWPVTKNAKVEIAQKTIAPDGSLNVVDLRGCGMVRSIRIKADSPDARIFRKALFEVYADGDKSPSVWSPLGDFFLDGFGQGISQSLLLGKKEGTYYCFYPMPFDKGLRMRITNDSKTDLKLDAEVIWEPMKKLPKDMGRFYAWWHRQNPTTSGQLFPILDAKGRGHWCGVSHAMQDDKGLFFLEGDEMAWVDDRDNTTYNGTGTEDYFDSGWYFGGPGNAPLYGCGVHDDPGSRCLAFRMHLTDYVPFQQKARIGIEHGTENSVQADYAGVTYWYAEPGTTHTFAPVSVDERMPRSPRVPGTIEAEDAIKGATMISDAELPFLLSAGRAVKGLSMTLALGAGDAGAYSLEGQLVASPGGGAVQISIDGKDVGDPIGLHADTLSLVPFRKLADIVWLKEGSHQMAFKSTGDVIVDCVRLAPKGVFEGENLKIKGSSGEDLGEQGLGADWSNHAQIWFRPKKAGAYFTLELPVDKAGVYTLYAYFTKAVDYGIVQVKLDGKPIGQPFDGYNNGVIRSERISLGTMDLSAGTHELTFQVTGKNARSTSYMVGVDSILLR